MNPHATCVIGAGAVGSSLALRLSDSGYPIRAVLSRTRASSETVAARIPSAVVIERVQDIPQECRLILLCVPDDELERSTVTLAVARDRWQGSFVAHVSGVHSIDVLAPIADRGGSTFGFHPIQTFPRRFDPDAFNGCYVGIEGDGDADDYGRALAMAIGAHPVMVASEDKLAYHLAASVASNHLVALLVMIERLADKRAPGSEWDLASFVPLIERTLQNALADGPSAALTGPVVRGDAATVARHLEVFEKQDPASREAYQALSRLLVEVATACNRLAPEARNAVIEALETARD
ncbi:MAG TPA: Rossmann-like and DUF2520 domain-containing protein [Rhodothermales bacterium]